MSGPRMRTMQARSIAVALLFALAALWLILDPRSAEEWTAPTREQRAADASTGAPAGELAAGRSPVRESMVIAPVSVNEEARELDAELFGRMLRLRVLERRSKRALPGLMLVLQQEGEELVVATDDAGYAATAAIWSPGEVHVFHRPDPKRAEYASEWRLDPWRVRVGAQAPRGGPELVQLEAEAPALTLSVVTELPDGAGLDAVEVSLVHGWRDESGGFHAEWVAQEATDGAGRARFSIFPEDARSTSLRLFALDRARGLASRSRFLDPPLQAGPFVLTMAPMGRVRVEAFDHAGRALARGRAVATSGESARAVMTLSGARIVDGSALLEHLPPGPLRVRVFDSGSADRREQEVEVEPGREARLSVHFDDGRSHLAAAGRVLDEEERGLGGVSLWMEVAGRVDEFTVTAPDGSFQFWSAPAEEVVVSTAGDAASDRFEPSTARAGFGATDMVLRRTAELGTRVVAFHVLDAVSDEPPEDGGGVFVLRGAPRVEGGWLWEELSQGRAELVLKWRPGLQYRVQCHGYLPVEGELLLDDLPDSKLTVRLRRGFRRALDVVDSKSGAVLAGARIRDEGGAIDVTTDVYGRALLEAREWPRRLRIEREGYLVRVVDPDDLELVTNRVPLSARDREE